MNKQQTLNAIKKVSPVANDGHHLDRLRAILIAFERHDEAEVIEALMEFCHTHHKIPYDGITEEFSALILHLCREVKLTAEEIAPIAWGLDHSALKEYNMVEARRI